MVEETTYQVKGGMAQEQNAMDMVDDLDEALPVMSVRPDELDSIGC